MLEEQHHGRPSLVCPTRHIRYRIVEEMIDTLWYELSNFQLDVHEHVENMHVSNQPAPNQMTSLLPTTVLLNPIP